MKVQNWIENGQKKGPSEPEVVRLTCTLGNKRQPT
jgi:hypothetical protein